MKKGGKTGMKIKKAAIAITAILTVTTVISPMAVSIHAQGTSTSQQTSGIGSLSVPAAKIGEVEINADNFPDVEFRKWIKANLDGAEDDKLTAAEIARVTKIDVQNHHDITDLTGIGYFTALTSLDCTGTGITSLDVSNNKALERLICYATKINKLNVSNNAALTFLDCSGTQINSLDVSNNKALETLYCADTQIDKLNVSNNTLLTSLSCLGIGITELDVSKNTALIDLNCSDTGITALNVSNNTSLINLYCYSTQINKLNVSNNTSLETLYCPWTQIDSLDVSKNTSLKYLSCYGTQIDSLDVSKNTTLEILHCSWTQIDSLDVSNNTSLTSLRFNESPLEYLNIGTNANFNLLNSNSSSTTGLNVVVELNVTSDDFDITDKITGIDISKVRNVSGANYDDATGIVSNHTVGRSITYDYGTLIKVTMNLPKADSTISITGSLDKTYDGNAVNDSPTVTKTGSRDAVTYTWEKKNDDGIWETITSAPIDVGTYRVIAILASDDNYNEASSAPVEFTIAPKNVEMDDHIIVPEITDKTDLEHLIIKDGDKELVQGIDYDVTKKEDGSKVSVIITFKGNYIGTITRTYTVNEDKPSGGAIDTESKGKVQTGDVVNTGIWTMLLALSLGVTALLTGKKRKM